jgi:hypothetical protein
VKLNWGTKLKETSVILFASCNNVFDINYAVMAGRPMPLRNFELGISLSANKSLIKQPAITPEN